MNIKTALLGLLSCTIFGGLISALSPIKWLAASLWVFSALFINGSIAMYEDALPGGFDNPDGASTPKFTYGIGAVKFWLKSLAISGLALASGFYVQLNY